jgi:WhiB family transcriptional regulator, redox-sensing transcriptional regulator
VPGTRGTTSQAVHREEWLDASACRSEDPELFFPITASGPSTQQIEAAKAVCQRCGVQRECLHYALDSHQSYGVWGGTSEEERLRMTAPLQPAPPRREPQPRAEARSRTDNPRSGRPRGENRSACAPSTGTRRPSRRIRSGREGRNAGYRA